MMSTYSQETIGAPEEPFVDPLTDPVTNPITDPMDPTLGPILPDDPNGLVPDTVDPGTPPSPNSSDIPIPDGTYDSSIPTDLNDGTTGPNDLDGTVPEEVVPL